MKNKHHQAETRERNTVVLKAHPITTKCLITLVFLGIECLEKKAKGHASTNKGTPTKSDLVILNKL